MTRRKVNLNLKTNINDFISDFMATTVWIQAQDSDPLGANKKVRYCCPKCNKNYKYRKHLTSHLTYECDKEPQFQCEVCLKKFHYRYVLNAHLRHIHQMYPHTP